MLVEVAQQLIELRLSHGASGNVSLRVPEGMIITPTGLAPDELKAADMVTCTLSGDVSADSLKPSSEWPMHAVFYQARPGFTAITPFIRVVWAENNSVDLPTGFSNQ